MPETAVSLIIPVYNSAPYMEKCLRSAVGQTLADMEIIIVDDGSSDGSISIVNDFSNTDRRIRVLHQNNKGPGAARNLGLMEAAGEYVAFMDSDDWIDPAFIERMYSEAVIKDADIVVCRHKKVMSCSSRLPVSIRRPPCMPDHCQAMKQVIKDSGIRGYVWDKLYKRSLFKDNSIAYPQGLYYEDLATTFKLFYHSKRVVILNEKLYYYLQRPNSLSKKLDPGQIHDRVTALEMMKAFLEQKGVLAEYGFEFQYLCIKMWMADIFCLAVIYTFTGKKGFLRSSYEVTRRTRSLVSIKQGKLADEEDAIKNLS